MKILFSILLLTLFSAFSFAQQAKEQNEPVIVAGKGWGVVALNAKRKVVETALGKGEGEERNKKLEDVYFRRYPEKGVQVSYRHKDDKVEAIFFYNKQRRYENFSTPSIKTDKSISWDSSPEDIIKAYGKPKNDFNDDDRGGTWRRMVFDGIDFRFENNVMVRIGLPETDFWKKSLPINGQPNKSLDVRAIGRSLIESPCLRAFFVWFEGFSRRTVCVSVPLDLNLELKRHIFVTVAATRPNLTVIAYQPLLPNV